MIVALQTACEAAQAHLLRGEGSREYVLELLRQALAPPEARLFDLTYPPSVNDYWRSQIVRGRGGRLIPSVYPGPKAKEYRALVQRLALVNGWGAPLAGDVAVWLDIYRPRRIGDLDNPIKVVLDALKGRAFIDDGQVAQIVALRHDDKNDPRAVVRVVPLG